MLKVLVVDDTRTIRYQLTTMLKNEGYEVIEAVDGQEALATALTERPDIALLDIMMPNIGGIECCRRLKGNTQTKAIKVIMVTSKSDLPKVREAFKAGCDGYLLKPVDKAGLMQKVKELGQFASAKRCARSVVDS